MKILLETTLLFKWSCVRRQLTMLLHALRVRVLEGDTMVWHEGATLTQRRHGAWRGSGGLLQARERREAA